MNICEVFKAIIVTIIGTCLSLVLVPLLLPLLIASYILCFVVILLIKIKYGNTASIATGQDVLFGMDTANSYTVINAAFRLAGQPEPDKLKSRILHLMANSVDEAGQKRYKRLGQVCRKEFGHLLWKDCDDFNIDKHVQVLTMEDLVRQTLEKEVDKTSGPITTSYIEELTKLKKNYLTTDWKILMKCTLNAFGTKRMDPNIPAWQVYLISETEDRFTTLYRFHHSIGDGIYISRMLCEGFLDLPTHIHHAYTPPTRLVKFIRYTWSFCLLPFGIWKIAKTNDKNPLHGPKLTGKKNFYLSNAIPFDTLKMIRSRTKTNTNSILFTMMSSALSLHFKRRNVNVKKVTVLIPAPLQNLQKPVVLRNKLAVLALDVPTPSREAYTSASKKKHAACSSLDRLKIMNGVIRDAKMNPSFLSAHFLITTFCSILPTRMAKLLLHPNGITLSFSNIPGPQVPIRFEGNDIQEMMFWNPDRDPLGVGLSILSYDRRLRIGLTLDEALFEDEQDGNLLLRDFENELQNIIQELDIQENSADNKCEKEYLMSVP